MRFIALTSMPEMVWEKSLSRAGIFVQTVEYGLFQPHHTGYVNPSSSFYIKQTVPVSQHGRETSSSRNRNNESNILFNKFGNINTLT